MKKANLIFISSIVLFTLISISLAQAGCVTIKVQYQDGCPRSNAIVKVVNSTYIYMMGTTNENGLKTRCDHDLSHGNYQAKAFWPDDSTQFGLNTPFHVDENGDGSTTITSTAKYGGLILDNDGNGVGDCHQPQWRNQGQNSSSIMKGTTNLLYAEAKSYKLDWAWLSTNETGSWQNKTYMDMSDTTDWIWSNFTWQNTSFTGILGWKIYYNDTSNFTNATNEMTFEVLGSTCGLSAGDINFGSVKTGEISLEKTVTLTNTGNSPTTSLTIKGIDWSSNGNSFDTSKTHYSETSCTTNDETCYNGMTSLPENPSTGTLSNIDPDSSLSVYFRLKIPEGQTQGNYTQQITFTATC